MATTSIKKMTFVAFSLLSLAAAANAGETDNKVRKLQREMNQTRTETATGSAGARTASAKAPIENSYNVNVTFDVLYWNPEIENNGIAQSSVFPPAPYGAGTPAAAYLPSKGDMTNLGYQWSWGFRAGLGYDIPHDNWDVGLEYTYFNSSASEVVSAGNNSYYKRSRGSAIIENGLGLAAFAEKVRAQGSLDIQNVDLTLGREYFISSNVAFKPSAGLTSAWIKSNETVQYGGGTTTAPSGVQGYNGNNTKVTDNCKSWGLGPQFGLATTWHLEHGFSFVGNVRAAAIYSSFKTAHRNNYSAVETRNIFVKNSFRAFIPKVDFVLGVNWETCFNNNRNHFVAGLGWETQLYFNQIQRFQSAGGITSSTGVYAGRDLSLQGITLNLRVDF